MVYFYSRKYISCVIDGEELTIEYEFSESGQQDGHNPWHGDMQRDWAECIIRNMDFEPVAAVLKEHDIKGFECVGPYNVKVEPMNKLCPGTYSPLYKMTLRIGFSPCSRTEISLARELITSMPWQVLKEGIQKGSSNSYYWDHGRKGNNS